MHLLGILLLGILSSSSSGASPPPSLSELREWYGSRSSELTTTAIESLEARNIWYCSKIDAEQPNDQAISWPRPRPWYRLAFDRSNSDFVVNSGLNPIRLFVRLQAMQTALAGRDDQKGVVEVEYLRALHKDGQLDALISEVTIGRLHPDYEVRAEYSRMEPTRKVVAYYYCPVSALRDRSIILDAQDVLLTEGFRAFLNTAEKTGFGSCSYRRTVTPIVTPVPAIRLRSGRKMEQFIRATRVDYEASEKNSGALLKILGGSGTGIDESTLLVSRGSYQRAYLTKLRSAIAEHGLLPDEFRFAQKLNEWISSGLCGD